MSKKYILLLALGIFGSAIADTSLDVSAASYYLSRDGKSTAYAALGAQLGVELSLPNRRFSAGLFADLELTKRATHRYGQLAGSWLSYRYERWDLSTVIGHFDSNDSAGQWIYASKLQFEVRPGHKLALTAAGAIGGGSGPALRLTYKTVVAGRASLSLSIGLGSHRMYDYGANTRIAWNLY